MSSLILKIPFTIEFDLIRIIVYHNETIFQKTMPGENFIGRFITSNSNNDSSGCEFSIESMQNLPNNSTNDARFLLLLATKEKIGGVRSVYHP